ncbi:MAG TPA: sigma-70 family RNA polymerase sigma factor [Acidimicrobiales bacterium]|nr:sigma-70 family RNA polymerase sigma factor [Acidimicrobiales bacterium]
MATTMPRSAALFDSSDAFALDWSGLYDEHAARLHRIAARRVGQEQAPDVVQEIFVRAYRNRHSIDGSRPIGAWLSTIALRASTDALRRRSARPDLVPVDEEPEPAVVGGGVDEEFENVVRREGIKAAFDSLPERQQRVFRHLALDGWTQEQVAAHEGISIDAVKSLFARARHTFKETYQAFADRMGVFGGVAVGTAVLRLRSRVQRVQSALVEHAGAFGVAAATVTVVAIATVPSTRPAPTRAAQTPDGAASEPAPSLSGTAVLLATPPTAPEPARPAAPAPDAPASATAAVAEASPAESGTTSVRAQAEAGRHGQGASAHVTLGTEGPDGDRRTYGGMNFDNCSTDVVSGAACATVDVVAATAGSD